MTRNHSFSLPVLLVTIASWAGARASPPPPPAQGSLDKEVVRGVIRDHIGEVRSCYEKELTRRAALAGRVMIQFTISGTGAVSAAAVQSSTLNNRIVERCIVLAVMSWEFPRPQGGGNVVVTYPFVLKSAEEEEAPADELLHALGTGWAKKVGEFHALRLYCEFLAARAQFGKAAVYGVGDVEPINATLSEALSRKGGAALAQQLDKALPALLIASDKEGHLWHWSRARYVLDFPVLAWDVDDVTGFWWAVDLDHRLQFYEPADEQWHKTSIANVRDFQASSRIIYFLQMDGALMAREKGRISRILDRTVPSATLVGSKGRLYLLEGGHLYRYDQGRWDRSATPIQSEVRSVVADGRDYYALYHSGQVYSSIEGRILEEDAKFTNIWLIGKNLIALARNKKVLGYSVAEKNWQVLR